MKKLKIILIVLLIILGIGYYLSPRGRIDVEAFSMGNAKIPPTFDGYRIVQISDLHNKDWSKNDKLKNLVKEFEPDIIVITGDLIDSRNPKPEVAYDFIKSIKDISPIYYVTGNHEFYLGAEEIVNELKTLGVKVLLDEVVDLEKDGEVVKLIGLNDPTFGGESYMDPAEAIVDHKFSNFNLKDEDYKILLSHRPELFETYVNNKVDLALTGHAHGGQIVLPFVGGLIAPDQGFFPKYRDGQYDKDETSMIVSRGLGDSILPVRINNNYHLVLVELKSKP